METITIITELFYFLKLQTNKEKFPFFGIEFRSCNLTCLMESSKISALKSENFDDGLEQTALRLTGHPQGEKGYMIKVKQNPIYPPP